MTASMTKPRTAIAALVAGFDQIEKKHHDEDLAYDPKKPMTPEQKRQSDHEVRQARTSLQCLSMIPAVNEADKVLRARVLAEIAMREIYEDEMPALAAAVLADLAPELFAEYRPDDLARAG